MIYKCLDCREYFAEPTTERIEEWSEYWGRPVAETIVKERCPHCGSEDITEVNECISCLRPTEATFCKECHKELDEYLKAIQEVFDLDYEHLQEFIAEHFGW